MKTHPPRLRAASECGDFEKQARRYMFSSFLLWYISKHDMYGYELIKKIEQEEGFPALTASRLYPVLKGMMRRGLISRKTQMQGNRAKKVYTITAAGRAALADTKKYVAGKPLRRQFLRELVE
jgi:PadR family transcriptional regulator PadR